MLQIVYGEIFEDINRADHGSSEQHSGGRDMSMAHGFNVDCTTQWVPSQPRIYTIIPANSL